jgi:predicted RNA-binding Zn-ribbon protein involved in translation (DUF1610 family)
MGYKNVCLSCHIAFNNANRSVEIKCPTCGEGMIWMPHRFRPPRKLDDNAWAIVKYLVEHGFDYGHIYEAIPDNPNGASRLVTYPTKLHEAKEFVKKYKDKAVFDNRRNV